MLIRVRSNVGVWRVELSNDPNKATISDVKKSIAQTRPDVIYTREFSVDPSGKQLVNAGQTLREQGLTQNGTMLHCRVDPSTVHEVGIPKQSTNSTTTTSSSSLVPTPLAVTTPLRRVIDKDGVIRMVPSHEIPEKKDKGFRKGMMALRDMKMSWTLADFVAMDSQFEFKIQRQPAAICQQVSVDVNAINHFQSYCQRFNFLRKRMAFLYGKFIPGDNNDNNQLRKTVVEAIYEPPQQVDNTAAEGFVLFDDPRESRVQQIAQWLGLQKVGWIFSHEPREKGFIMTGAEIIMAAEYQLQAADGVNETPFVTIQVSPNPEDGHVSVEAFQVSQQCMAMVAEQALEVNVQDPKLCNVNETFSAIQEGKESKTLDNNFFLTVVPIVQHSSELLVADFPKLNRDLDDRMPNHDALKRELSKSGTAGWTFEDRLADFNLLIYLADYLDVDHDLPRICASLLNRQDMPLDDGYKLIIKSLAGMEGSY